MEMLNDKIVNLPIVVEQDEDGFYIVSCPIYKGCHTYGKTIDEALDNIHEVIEMCIDEDNQKQGITTNRFIGFREMKFPLKTKIV
jgi:predicted RNase H-like HicB family nuclease